MLGIYSSATLVGRTLAPILGGAIISLFAGLSGDWNYRLVYAGAFILAIPVFILSFLIVNDSSAASEVKKVTPRDFGDSLGTFVTNRRLLGTALVEMATYLPMEPSKPICPCTFKAKDCRPTR